ncbi:MAG TPA: hypothetical protein PKV17_08740 [Aquabacterium sp.]|jgi:hypothetical protein|nr:hypothetical protein [Aquabacterium sp.]HRH28852.1 hypothetical protein [Aquabacterium sp.]
MHDEYQIHIPPSFSAVHSDARQRLTIPLSQLRERYEVCEDLASHLVEHSKGIHVDIGVDEQEVLLRIHRGLMTPESGLAPGEATWVVTRLAELLGWPLPEPEALAPQSSDDEPR